MDWATRSVLRVFVPSYVVAIIAGYVALQYGRELAVVVFVSLLVTLSTILAASRYVVWRILKHRSN